MTQKQYTAIRLLVAMALAAFVSASIVRQEFFWPVVAVACALLLLLVLRRFVQGVLADERDYALGGRAARWAIQIFSMAAVLLMFFFLARQDTDPAARIVANVLAYSTCALMLLYSAIFTFLRRKAS
ncbi:MAG: DUF2178 domain-containing protein [Candidatus Peribacteraceae bacterium]|nr:DUF2178 domain-containing protein [Candidatus Peribacteraceae bacterium]